MSTSQRNIDKSYITVIYFSWRRLESRTCRIWFGHDLPWEKK